MRKIDTAPPPLFKVEPRFNFNNFLISIWYDPAIMYYHIYNRGNTKQQLFLSTNDYLRFLSRVKQYSIQYEIRFTSWSLMPNHFHLGTANMKEPNSIPLFMHNLSTAYSMYFNAKHHKTGHVFQGKYKIREITSVADLLHLSRYIHQNCVELTTLTDWEKAKRFMRRYKWSSYRFLITNNQPRFPFLSYEILGYFENSIASFKTYNETPITKWEREVGP